MKIPEDQIGDHANMLDTSELLFVAPKHIRRDRLTGNDYPNNGVSGDPAKSIAGARQGVRCRSRSTTRWRRSSG